MASDAYNPIGVAPMSMWKIAAEKILRIDVPQPIDAQSSKPSAVKG
jgi:hypothetical protein